MLELLQAWLIGNRDYFHGVTLNCILGENEPFKRLLEKEFSTYSHKRLIAEELKQLNNQITKADRDKIRKKIDCSKQYLSNYMNGRIGDIDKATEILVFIKSMVQKRRSRISSLLQ